jgi:hypothetical protein
MANDPEAARKKAIAEFDAKLDAAFQKTTDNIIQKFHPLLESCLQAHLPGAVDVLRGNIQKEVEARIDRLERELAELKDQIRELRRDK